MSKAKERTDRMSMIQTSVYWSEVTNCPVLQVDTNSIKGLDRTFRIDVNDGAVYFGDPEGTLETAHQKAVAQNGSPATSPSKGEPDNVDFTPDGRYGGVLLQIALLLASRDDWDDGMTEIAEIVAQVFPHPGLGPGHLYHERLIAHFKNGVNQ